MKKLREDVTRFCQLQGQVCSVSTLKFFILCFSPRMIPVVLLRLSEISNVYGLGLFGKLFSILNVLLFGIEVSPKVKIGGGLFLPHTVGTVIGAASIGKNCTIMQGVTLGASEMDLGFDATRRPIIGNYVTIGSGAKVIGHITVGDHAKIGANAVVLCDVPAFAVAVGVPAKLILKNANPNKNGE